MEKIYQNNDKKIKIFHPKLKNAEACTRKPHYEEGKQNIKGSVHHPNLVNIHTVSTKDHEKIQLHSDSLSNVH